MTRFVFLKFGNQEREHVLILGTLKALSRVLSLHTGVLVNMTAFLMHMKSAGCRGGTFPYDSAVGSSVLHLFSSLWVLCSSFREPRISSPLVNQMALPSPDKGVGTGCNQGQSDTLS